MSEIGKEAKELDKKSIKERARIERSTAIKMLATTIIYFVIMIILFFLL